jgi:hypothetical protein
MSNALRRPSSKTRFAIFIGLLAAVLLGIAAFVCTPAGTLKLICHHNFRSADITVYIDGEVVHTGTMTGVPVKRLFGVLEKTEGAYTRTIPVKSGKHVVEVRLRAPGYDNMSSIHGDFERGKESILGVDAGRDLSLLWRRPGGWAGGTEQTSDSSVWVKYAVSAMLTLGGSILSATIGVLVQDFLRSRKAGHTETEVRQESSKIVP